MAGRATAGAGVPAPPAGTAEMVARAAETGTRGRTAAAGQGLARTRASKDAKIDVYNEQILKSARP